MDLRNKPIERIFTVATPAVATGFSITPNTAAGWMIRSLRFQLVTDANIADRAVMLSASDGSTNYFLASAGATQAASLTRNYGGVNGFSDTSNVGTFIGLRFPDDGIWLPQGHTLTVSVENIQAGDQVSAIGGRRWEFPTGPREYFWPFITTLMEESS